MNYKEIELNKFYKMKDSTSLRSIFIFNVEDYYFQNGKDSNVCEKWIYWDLGKKEFGSFTYLNKTIIENLSKEEGQIRLRNLKDTLIEDMEGQKERFEKRFELIDIGIEDFCSTTVLSEL